MTEKKRIPGAENADGGAIADLVTALKNDDDPELDIDECLHAVAEGLSSSGVAREAFNACGGHRAVMQYFCSAYLEQCAAVLSLTACTGWPEFVVHRLIQTAMDERSSKKTRKVALFLLDIGSANESLRNVSYLSHPQWNIGSLIERLARSPDVPRVGIVALANMLKRYEGDTSSFRRSKVRILRPLLDLAISLIPQQDVEKAVSKPKESGKAAPWFCRTSVLLLLETLSLLTKDKTLLLGEAFKKEPDTDKMAETLFLKDMVRVANAFHKCSPLKSCPVLGWNGRVKSYERRPFPLKIDAHESVPKREKSAFVPGYRPSDTTPSGRSGIELCLDILRGCAFSGAAAKVLYTANITGLTEELCKYTDDQFRHSLADFYGQITRHSKVCYNEICEDKNVVGLMGVIQSGHSSLRVGALDALHMAVDTLSGNDFIWFANPNGGLSLVSKIVMEEHDHEVQPDDALLKAASRVFTASIDRSRRMQGLNPLSMPRGGFWSSEPRNSIQMTENRATGILNSTRSASEQPPPPSPSSKPTTTTSRAQQPKTNSKTESSKASPTPKDQENGAGGDTEYDEDGLRVAYDSAPKGPVKEWRKQWRAMSIRDKVRWRQTSTDVLVWIKVPQGTKAKEVVVVVKPNQLTVKLGWFGRVVDGPLFRRCKARESMWVLEDDEVHVMLPKDDAHCWKGLFEGGEEKGYMELLKEMVDADERVAGYDELDDRAKELIEDIRERQQMIHDGYIDLEGFDDFRVVIGENSL